MFDHSKAMNKAMAAQDYAQSVAEAINRVIADAPIHTAVEELPRECRSGNSLESVAASLERLELAVARIEFSLARIEATHNNVAGTGWLKPTYDGFGNFREPAPDQRLKKKEG